MNPKTLLLSAFCGAALLPLASNAQIYSNPGMTDAGNWTVNATTLAGGAASDYVANFGCSYTSALGVPQDPYSSSTTALQLKINETAGVQAGVSVSPTSLSFSGPFRMTFDMWWNYNSGGFTGGSTQVGSYGLTPAANKVQWAGVGTGQLFGVITDNGSSTSYRGYNNGSSLVTANFAAASQSYANAYYTALFPSVACPAGETALNASQYGNTVAGTVGFQWQQVAVNYDGTTLSESINGHLIASYAVASVGPDIFLGMYDINASSAGKSGLADENFTLFDNVQVVQTPEPTTCALAVLGGIGLFLARRRS